MEHRYPTRTDLYATTLKNYAKATRSTATSTNDELMLRLSFTLEELAEWLRAHANGDLEAMADAWADRLYVLLGDAVATGLPADQLFQEVHRSNMTKIRGTNASGKAIKGLGYETANIASILKGNQ